MSADVRVVIGRVVGCHGIRGTLKILPLTDYPERFLSMDALAFYRDGAPAGKWNVREMRRLEQRGIYLASLEGVEDNDAAERLRGCTVEVRPEERVPLPENEFWVSDLIGLEAHGEDGERLGIVKDVVESGASQLLVIAGEDGREHYIPAVPEFFLGASPEEGRIALRLIDGLWEL